HLGGNDEPGRTVHWNGVCGRPARVSAGNGALPKGDLRSPVDHRDGGSAGWNDRDRKSLGLLCEATYSAMTDTPLLEITGLGKSFGGLRAVSDLSFRGNSREVLGIIGPNGAGKTPAVNLISGVIKPDAGQINLLGEAVQGYGPHRL